MNKNFPYVVDISKNKKPIIMDAKIFSQDKNSAYFSFAFKQDGLPIRIDDTYSAKVMCIFRSSGRVYIENLTTEEDIFKFKFNSTLIDSWDVVDAYLYLYQDDIEVDCLAFTFKVDVSKIDEIISDIRTYYVTDIETIREDYEKKLEGLLTALKDEDKGYKEDVALLQKEYQQLLSDKSNDAIDHFNTHVDSIDSAAERSLDLIEQWETEVDQLYWYAKSSIAQNIALIDDGKESIQKIIDDFRREVVSFTNDLNKETQVASAEITRITKEATSAKDLAVFNISADQKYVSTIKNNVTLEFFNLETQVADLKKRADALGLVISSMENATKP